MMVPKPIDQVVTGEGIVERLTVCLDMEALDHLAGIATCCERRTGITPSRSQIVRVALRAYYDAVQ